MHKNVELIKKNESPPKVIRNLYNEKENSKIN